MAQIEIKNLTFFYPDMEKGEYLENPALCNINLEIHRGEIYGYMRSDRVMEKYTF